jgi:hypothetical protein
MKHMLPRNINTENTRCFNLPMSYFHMATVDTMPGSYFPDLDHSPRPSLHLTTTNARPLPFLPPSSQSATSALSKSRLRNAQTPIESGCATRKRIRSNNYTSDSTLTTPQHATSWTALEISSAHSSAIYTPGVESPTAFVNTRYTLAGGLDTPSAARLDSEEQSEADARELDYRPNRMTITSRQRSGSYFPRTPNTTANQSEAGHKRKYPDDQRGWGRAVVNLVGGVAGKVINFCWNSAFRGFQAGGGQAYRMDSSTPAVVGQSSWTDVQEKDDVFNQHYEGQRYRSTTPVPGQFLEEGFIRDYMLDPQSHQARQVSTPIQFGDEGGSSLRSNWVLVDGRREIDRRSSSPVHSTHRTFRPSSYNSRRPPTRSLLGTTAGNRPRLVPSRPSLASSPNTHSNRPASFASPRASPNRSYTDETAQNRPSSAGHRRTRSSMASPRRLTEMSATQSITTPTSPEVQKFEKKLRRRERKEDENIQRLNRQLQDMIREGKEALGTTIDIEDEEDEDEGYEEGVEVMGVSKW